MICFCVRLRSFWLKGWRHHKLHVGRNQLVAMSANKLGIKASPRRPERCCRLKVNCCEISKATKEPLKNKQRINPLATRHMRGRGPRKEKKDEPIFTAEFRKYRFHCPFTKNNNYIIKIFVKKYIYIYKKHWLKRDKPKRKIPKWLFVTENKFFPSDFLKIVF